MNDRTQEIVEGMKPAAMSALEISGDDWKGKPWKSYKSVGYPDFDICKDVLPETFDIILAEQVWEHLPYPARAVRHVRQMLNPQGIFMLTTPFLIRIHRHPIDCTRWTTEGMTYFLEECGFDRDKIQTGCWGNRDCVVANFRGWPEFKEGVSSVVNEPNYPLVVWAVARMG